MSATFTSSHHRVVRRPQCPTCGDEALHRPDRPPVPVCSQSEPQGPSQQRGRARRVAGRPPWRQYRHLVSPVSGVVTWLSRTTDETDSWLHVYWAGSNPGMRSRSLSSLRRSLRSKSAGKGSTRHAVQRSALFARRSSAIRAPVTGTRSVSAGDSSSSPGEKRRFTPTTCSCSATSQLDDAESHQRERPPLQHRPAASRSPTPRSIGPRSGR